jgi:hypothetical protein
MITINDFRKKKRYYVNIGFMIDSGNSSQNYLVFSNKQAAIRAFKRFIKGDQLDVRGPKKSYCYLYRELDRTRAGKIFKNV